MVADTDERKPSARDRLVSICSRGYQLGRTADDRVFIVPLQGANVALFSGAAKARLAADYLTFYGSTVGRTPLDEAWLAMEGRALAVDKIELPLRVARHGQRVVIDIGTPDGSVIEVDAGGWRVVDRSPVTFRRSKAQRPLPTPLRGAASWPDLWALFTLPESQRDLVRAWLATALIRDIPHPILNVEGAQGARKSTFARQVSGLLDPCAVDSVSVPRDADSWATSAQARWVISVDNVSKIDPWWSDDLCRTVTGSGRIKRQLYTDDDVTVIVNKGVVILNGITMAGAMRPDLAERMLPLELTRPSRYLPESVVAAEFDRIAAGVLALILDDVATILASTAEPQTGDLRMADFAVCLGKLDAAAGTAALDAYRELHQEHAEAALAADPVARCVQELMAARGGTWTGKAHELLKALDAMRETLVAVGEVAEDGYWPKDATRMGSALTRSAALLERGGIRVDRDRNRAAGRLITITASRDAGDAKRDAGDAGRDASVTPEAPESPTNGPFGDAGDAGDADSPVLAFLRRREGEEGETQQGGRQRHQRHSVTDVTCHGCSQPLSAMATVCRACGEPAQQVFAT